MEFQDRLKRAIARGEKSRNEHDRLALDQQLSLDELKSLHSGYRLELSEHIESCLKQLAEELPGFEYQTIVNDDGWGGRLTRDDLHLVPGKAAETRYSRFEALIAPFSSGAIVELITKATVRNREVMNRKSYQKVDEFNIDSFKEMVDHRVLEFAENYSAS